MSQDYENRIFNEDCLTGMARLPDGCVDMILCDLPYGTTQCKWDVVIPFEPLWAQYERVIKPNGAIVLTASQPFTSFLVASNPGLFKYEWIWEKSKATQHALCKLRPLKAHENILVFYRRQPTYNPQMEKGAPYKGRKNIKQTDDWTFGVKRTDNAGTRYPRSVHYEKSGDRNGRLHPTQKPVELFEYLIKTYTNLGDPVLDNCMGSGTTAVACLNTGRRFVGFELDKGYFEIASRRIAEARRTGSPKI